MNLTKQSFIGFRSVYLNSHNKIIGTSSRNKERDNKQLVQQLLLIKLATYLYKSDMASSQTTYRLDAECRYDCSCRDINDWLWS